MNEIGPCAACLKPMNAYCEVGRLRVCPGCVGEYHAYLTYGQNDGMEIEWAPLVPDLESL